MCDEVLKISESEFWLKENRFVAALCDLRVKKLTYYKNCLSGMSCKTMPSGKNCSIVTNNPCTSTPHPRSGGSPALWIWRWTWWPNGSPRKSLRFFVILITSPLPVLISPKATASFSQNPLLRYIIIQNWSRVRGITLVFSSVQQTHQSTLAAPPPVGSFFFFLASIQLQPGTFSRACSSSNSFMVYLVCGVT